MATYDTSGDLVSWLASQQGTAALSGAMLGKNTVEDTTSNQTTAQTTAQNVAGATATTGTNTTGTTGSSTQNSTGTNATTGTVGTTGTTSSAGKETSTATANLDPLTQVFNKQIQGVTPEMLQSIFTEGSKQVPGLVNTYANALGARVDGNTPLAKAVRDMNVDLTSKAAMLNMQSITDAGTSAGKIADATKSITTANTGTQQTAQQQTQDLLQSSSQQAVTQQVQNVINQIAQNTTQNQDTTSSVNQKVDATKQTQNEQQQVLNSNLLGKAAGLIGSGLGIAGIYKTLTGNSVLKDVGGFVKSLLASGVPVAEVNKELVASGMAQLDLNYPQITDSILNQWSGAAGSAADWGAGTFGDLAGGFTDSGSFWDTIGSTFGFADGGQVNFADGGQPAELLAVPDLLKEAPKVQPQEDAGNGLLALLGLGGSGIADALMAAAGAGSSRSTSIGSNAPLDTSGSGDGSVGGVNGTSIGNIGTAAGGTGMSNSVAGMLGSVASAVTGIPGLATAAQGLNNAANNHAANVNAEEADAGMNAAAAAANAEGFGPSGTMGDSSGGFSLGSVSVGDGGLGIGNGGFGGLGGIGLGLGSEGIGESASAAAGESSSGAAGDSGAASGDSGGGGGGGGGGCFLTTAVTDATGGGDDDPMLQTMRKFRDDVMRKDPKLSQLVDKYYKVAPAVVAAIDKRPDAKQIYSSMREKYLQPGVSAVNNGDTKAALEYYSAMMDEVGQYAHNQSGMQMQAGAESVLAAITGSGGLIQGPGTGTSDSIPAAGPGGRQLRVSNGEYIIPADTVAALGTQHFDKLVEKTHTPAAQQ